MHFHSLADCILPLDVGHGTATHSKVLSYHSEVIVPAFIVTHNFSLKLLECERGNVIRQLMLRKDLSWYFLSIVLILNDAYNHAL